MERGTVRNPIMVLFLPYFTCGIYGFVWFFQLCDDLNKGLGRDEFSPVKELLFSIVTCGLWAVWFTWRACEAVVEVQRLWGVQESMDAVVLFVMGWLGLGPLFMQMGLNNAWENGTPSERGSAY